MFKITQLSCSCCTDGVRMALVDLHSNGFKGTPGCIAISTALMQRRAGLTVCPYARSYLLARLAQSQREQLEPFQSRLQSRLLCTAPGACLTSSFHIQVGAVDIQYAKTAGNVVRSLGRLTPRSPLLQPCNMLMAWKLGRRDFIFPLCWNGRLTSCTSQLCNQNH
jgi:hypothetical protein